LGYRNDKDAILLSPHSCWGTRRSCSAGCGSLRAWQAHRKKPPHVVKNLGGPVARERWASFGWGCRRGSARKGLQIGIQFGVRREPIRCNSQACWSATRSKVRLYFRARNEQREEDEKRKKQIVWSYNGASRTSCTCNSCKPGFVSKGVESILAAPLLRRAVGNTQTHHVS
jgi:hypothetical protein